MDGWEGLAQWLLDETCMEAPISAYRLADACDLEVVSWVGSGAMLDTRSRRIHVNAKARLERRHGLIAHEIGHWLLREFDEDSEAGARFLSGALLLPRRTFSRDLRETWRLSRLKERHPNASAEMIARRIVELREAVVTIIDGRATRRIVSDSINDVRLHRISQWERDLADAALESGSEVEGDGLCYASPIINDSWRRVIVVCDAEQLTAKITPRCG